MHREKIAPRVGKPHIVNTPILGGWQCIFYPHSAYQKFMIGFGATPKLAYHDLYKHALSKGIRI